VSDSPYRARDVAEGIPLVNGLIQNRNFRRLSEGPNLCTREVFDLSRQGSVMTCKHIRVVVPAPVEAPRGAEWAASAAVWIGHGSLLGAHLVRRLAGAGGKKHPDDRAPSPPCRYSV
jgi:hypothetical protein